MYLTVSEELRVPIRAVAAPLHVFLRYDDGTTQINIETESGSQLTDAQYIERHRIAPGSVKKGVYLESLSTERFLAQIHSNIGVVYSEGGDFRRAEREYRESLSLDPKLPAAWYNLGKDLQSQGLLKKAVRAFSKALRLDPNDTWALNNRAMAQRQQGNVEAARKDLEEALRINPGFEQARRNLAGLVPSD